jgi:hypothetical protein
MMGSRLLKIGALIIILVTTLACGCNLSNLNLQDRIASIIAGNFLGDLSQGKTGDIRNDPAGMAFTVPNGFQAMVTTDGDTTIAPKGNLTFSDPFVSIMILKYEGDKEYAYWLNNQHDNMVYNQKANIYSEEDVTISGYSGKRYDYSGQFVNPDNENDKKDMTGYKIVLDLAPERVMLLDAFWPTDRDDEIRPLFEKWLASLELYEPVAPKQHL